MLGRPSGPNLVVTGGGATGIDEDEEVDDRIGSESAFEPLLVQQVEGPVDIAAFTQACYVAKKRKRGAAGRPTLARRLLREGGEEVGALDDLPLELDSDGAVHCGTAVDVIPPLPGGDYVFEVALRGTRGGGDLPPRRVGFAVGDGSGDDGR